MADQITDGRTPVTSADATTGIVDLAGGAAGTLDTEIFFEGTGSVGYSTQNSRDGLLFDAGSAQDWSNNTFYFLVNCGIVGLLAAKSAGGLTIRFCGATVTNWFEVQVAGSDDWPNSIAGGWTPFVVDVETAAASPSATNGTPPATTAIRYVGISTVTSGTMPRMVDNTWLDAIWRLPDGTAGILVEGQNGGAAPWAWADVVAASDAGSWATARSGPGGSVVLSTPVQIGINDATDHAFTDANVTILWDNQEFIDDTLYSISAIGGTSTTNITAGIKAGSGDAATGSQGWSIQAAASGARWSLDVDDANLTSVGLYGCVFSHGGTFNLTDAAVETISSFFIDCTEAFQSADLYQRNTIIDANTLDGTPFLSSANPANVRFCSFQFSDGHAMEITSAAGSPYSFLGNDFSGYGADGTTDAAILADGLTLTLNIASGGSTPTVRELNSANVTVNNNVSVTLTGLRDNTEIRVLDNSTGEFLDGIEDATTGTTDDRSFTFSLSAGTIVDIAVFNIAFVLPPNNRIENFEIPTADASIPISQIRDRNYVNL